MIFSLYQIDWLIESILFVFFFTIKSNLKIKRKKDDEDNETGKRKKKKVESEEEEYEPSDIEEMATNGDTQVERNARGTRRSLRNLRNNVGEENNENGERSQNQDENEEDEEREDFFGDQKKKKKNPSIFDEWDSLSTKTIWIFGFWIWILTSKKIKY